jgi:hypothetical protein
MTRKPILLALACLAGAGVSIWAPGPAYGCNSDYKQGYSPEDIKARRDVRKITGIFRLITISGRRYTDEDGKEWIEDAKLVGELTDNRGRIWPTIHDPSQTIVLCIHYFKPERDAKGSFWISRHKKTDRYELLHWEGEYLPDAEQTPLKAN